MKIKLLVKKILKKYLFQFFNIKINQNENFPIETPTELKEFINISSQYSMTGINRMCMLTQAVLNVKNKKIKGDFVECGVWRGGNILLYKLLNDLYNLNRKIFAYDTFQGMTKPQDIDINFLGIPAKKKMKLEKKAEDLINIHAYSKLNSVKKNILKHTNLKNINFIKGPVEKTLKIKQNLPSHISILRLDTDFYSSTKIALETLYPKLAKGGILIIDDYGHFIGAKKAVDDFFDNKKWLHVVDYSCRYLIKD